MVISGGAVAPPMTPTPTRTTTPYLTPSLSPTNTPGLTPSATPTPTPSTSLSLSFTFTVNAVVGNPVTLPTSDPSATYNYIVDWGDGNISPTITTFDATYKTHIYSSSGSKTIKITGICQDFTCQFTSIATLITSITNWGNCDFRALNFYGCTNLLSLPSGPITGASSMTIAASMFYNCTNLTTVPTYLFRNLTNVTSFANTFQNCTNLQLNPDIFYIAGSEESTRFLNKTVSFVNCFNISSFTGTQGTAPDLWNCASGSGAFTKTGCFGGHSTSSLSNYGSIPSAWL